MRQRAEGHHKPLPAQENEGRREGQPLIARQKRTGIRLTGKTLDPVVPAAPSELLTGEVFI